MKPTLPVGLTDDEHFYLAALVSADQGRLAPDGVDPVALHARLSRPPRHLEVGPSVPCPECCSAVLCPFDHVGVPARQVACLTCGRELHVQWASARVVVLVRPELPVYAAGAPVPCGPHGRKSS